MTSINKKNVVYFVLVLLMIYWAGSFSVAHNIISGWIFAIAFIAALLFALLFAGIKIRINQKYLIAYTTLIILISLSVLVNGENILNEMVLFLMLGLFMIAASLMDFETFRITYIRVMEVVCVVSLVFFTLYNVFPQLNSFMVVKDLDGASVSNIFIFNKFVNLNRNCGFFWEPGTFQTFIVFAMLFSFSEKRISAWRFIIFSIAIITTFSTTGYITLFFLILLAFFRKTYNKKTIRTIILLGAVVMIAFVLKNKDLFFSYYATSTTFGKIIQLFDNSNLSYLTSASVRFNAITKPLEVFFYNPLFGTGFDGLKTATYEYTHGMNTCTFVNYFAVYGLLYGIFAVRGYVFITRKLFINGITALFALLIIFISMISENYVRNSFFTMLIVLGNVACPVSKKNKMVLLLPYNRKVHA